MSWALSHPWWTLGLLMAAWIVGYEALAVWSQWRRWERPFRTLSQIATRQARRYPWLPWVWLAIVASVTALLYRHFGWV